MKTIIILLNLVKLEVSGYLQAQDKRIRYNRSRVDDLHHLYLVQLVVLAFSQLHLEMVMHHLRVMGRQLKVLLRRLAFDLYQDKGKRDSCTVRRAVLLVLAEPRKEGLETREEQHQVLCSIHIIIVTRLPSVNVVPLKLKSTKIGSNHV